MLSTAAIAVIAAFFILSVLLVVLRRRRARLASVRANPPGRRLSKVPKPWNAPAPNGYPAYYQTASPPPPPPPPPVHTPQYPPRGYETYHSYSQSQWAPPSPSQSIPQSNTLRSTYAPSATTSRPISSADPPFSVRSSVHRNEPITPVPSNPSSSPPLPSSHSTQRDAVESPLRPLYSSPPPRSPSVMVPPAVSSPRLPAATSPPRVPPLSMPLTSMSTGASRVIDEPPPAYTPV